MLKCIVALNQNIDEPTKECEMFLSNELNDTFFKTKVNRFVREKTIT